MSVPSRSECRGVLKIDTFKYYIVLKEECRLNLGLNAAKNTQKILQRKIVLN